jgi:hypothetical protein
MEEMKEGQDCMAFGYYTLDGKLVGWYADTFGSIRDNPKIYGYSDRQMEVVLGNTKSKVKRIREEVANPAVEVISSMNAVGGAMLKIGVDANEKILKDLGKFEMKVFKAPISNESNGWKYPTTEEMNEWKANLGEPFYVIRFEI